MLDNIDRRAEQEAVAMKTLQKYRINIERHKPILHNNIARTGIMPPQVIRRKSKKTYTPEIKHIRKQIPVFNLED
jgi:hypothetical protein